MSLITCSECAKEMSESAKSCPHCGKPNTSIEKRSVGFFLGVGIFLFPLIFAWFTLRKGHSNKSRIIAFVWAVILTLFVAIGESADTNKGKSVNSAVQKEEVIEVNIRELLSSYENNEIGADNKYKNKIIQVTGTISSVKKDIMNNFYVTLGTGAVFEIPEVQAFFDDSMGDQLGNLGKGNKLTVVCRVEGLMMNVLARDCIIK